MVWAGYRAKLNQLVLSVLDDVEKNVPHTPSKTDNTRWLSFAL
jgi:hypothetical protein